MPSPSVDHRPTGRQKSAIANLAKRRIHPLFPQTFHQHCVPTHYFFVQPPLDAPPLSHFTCTKEMVDAILGFHMHFKKIHPFDDNNSRVGRLIMVKECLRHNIVPFIIDDKHRGSYNKGIQCWSSNKSVLSDVCIKAQDRFNRQLELQKLLQRNKNL